MAEKGFYHPDRGYWQTTNTPKDELRASYPSGTIEVPLKPGSNYDWDGSQWVYVKPIVIGSDVNSERVRRISKGFDTTLTGHDTTVKVEGGAEARENINALALAALLRKQSGDTTVSTYRDRDNVDHDLTPDQLLELYQKSMAYAEGVYKASWVLKAMDPIPQDYTDDKYWP